MSNVSTKYSTAANSNAKLGSISLKENETRYRDLNDLFRLLMADARQESNEVRSLISTARSEAATARSQAATARGEAAEAKTLSNNYSSQIASIQTTASQANSRANAAEDTAEQALQATAGIQAVATQASQNANAIGELSSRVLSLEEANAHDAALVTVDGTTIDNTGGVLKAIDVEVGDNDLASARGQLGRTAVSDGADVNALLLDGWYAVGGTGVQNAPEGATVGVCRTSSGFASGTAFQTFFSLDETPRVFIRTFDGTNFTAWREPIFSNALAFENGVITADLSTVLPVAGEDDYDRCLSGGGTWKDVATPEDLAAVDEALDSFAESLSEIRTALEAVEAQVAAEPDGETVMVVDGAYTVPTYLGATEEEAGIAGLVPAAEIADRDKFLRGDGTWADTAMEPPTFDGETAGLVPAPEEAELEEGAEDRRFLKHDGTWEDPCEDLAGRVTALEEESGTEAIMERVVALENGADSEEIDLIFWPPSESESGEGGE